MLAMMQENAIKGVFTTFVGIGVDFNTSLVKEFAKVKGCNWFSVKSPKAFKKLMNENFAYIVTLAAFDVKVDIGPEAPFEVEAVYGSPGHSPNHPAVLCEVNSMFPSSKESEQLTKGGVVVVKLRLINDIKEQILPLVTKYFDPRGNAVRFVSEVKFKPGEDYFEDECVRKAVLLTRYVAFAKEYMRDGHAVMQPKTPTSIRNNGHCGPYGSEDDRRREARLQAPFREI